MAPKTGSGGGGGGGGGARKPRPLVTRTITVAGAAADTPLPRGRRHRAAAPAAPASAAASAAAKPASDPGDAADALMAELKELERRCAKQGNYLDQRQCDQLIALLSRYAELEHAFQGRSAAQDAYWATVNRLLKVPGSKREQRLCSIKAEVETVLREWGATMLERGALQRAATRQFERFQADEAHVRQLVGLYEALSRRDWERKLVQHFRVHLCFYHLCVLESRLAAGMPMADTDERLFNKLLKELTQNKPKGNLSVIWVEESGHIHRPELSAATVSCALKDWREIAKSFSERRNQPPPLPDLSPSMSTVAVASLAGLPLVLSVYYDSVYSSSSSSSAPQPAQATGPVLPQQADDWPAAQELHGGAGGPPPLVAPDDEAGATSWVLLPLALLSSLCIIVAYYCRVFGDEAGAAPGVADNLPLYLGRHARDAAGGAAPSAAAPSGGKGGAAPVRLAPVDWRDLPAFVAAPVPEGAGALQCTLQRVGKPADAAPPTFRLLMSDSAGKPQLAMSARKSDSRYVLEAARGVGWTGRRKAGPRVALGELEWRHGDFVLHAAAGGEAAAMAYGSSTKDAQSPREMRASIAAPGRAPAEGLLLAGARGSGSGDESESSESSQDDVVVLESKRPEWSQQMSAFVLDFRGRVQMASTKNFQLVVVGAEPGPDDVVLQFGKVEADSFSMDLRYPMSPMQAFAICLSVFDYRLACMLASGSASSSGGGSGSAAGAAAGGEGEPDADAAAAE